MLVSAGMVKSVADLFSLHERDLLRLGRFGEVSSRNLIRAIQNSKRTELARFLNALGIPGVGIRTARELAAHFGTLEALQNATVDQVRAAPGIGPSVAQAVVEFLKQPAIGRMIQLCRERGLEVVPPAGQQQGSFAGKTVVFTGVLQSMSRSEVEDLVRRLGGSTSDSVGRSTDLVVAGAQPGTKYDKARAIGVPILDERRFLRLARSRGRFHSTRR